MNKNLIVLFASITLFVTNAIAQVEPPDRKFLFLDDRTREQKEVDRKRTLKQQRKAISSLRKEKITELPFDINAENLKYDPTTDTLNADGNVIISHTSSIIESDRARLVVGTNQAVLSGDVRISDPSADVTANKARINIETGVGRLEGSSIYFPEGNYTLNAQSVNKLGQDEYEFKSADLTTCLCPSPEDCTPWKLHADRARVEQEGFGQAWDATLKFHDIPVFYTPYLFFPIKSSRQTGFLPARFGSGRRSGFDLELPFFWAISQSADATITPIYQSNIRFGGDLEYRKIFSRDHKLQFGLRHFNESARDGDLLGTNVDGLSDPTIDENRTAAYLDHRWSGDLFGLPSQLILDGNYISDDLVLREFEIEKIGDASDRFVTSTAVLRAPFSETISASLSAEYNQAIVTDDDFVFQRLPELKLNGYHSFKPFSQNPYGLKLVLKSELSAASFKRTTGYDGNRFEINEVIKLPFYYRNFYDAEFSVGLRASQYNLDDRDDVSRSTDDEGNEVDTVIDTLDSSSSRFVPDFQFKVSTVLEKVLNADKLGIVKRLAELGPKGRLEKVSRFKHTLEPQIKYRYVPNVNQDDNPQFDSNDRLAKRNVVTYELVQRLFARYEPRDKYLYGIEETAPEVEDLGSLSADTDLDKKFNFGVDSSESAGYRSLRGSSVRELATLKLSQSVDIEEARNNSDPDRDSVSDLSAALTLYPNYHFRLKAKANYDINDTDFSSYSLGTQMIDKRGDELRLAVNFVDQNVRQYEGSLQLNLMEGVKLGYYGRYDDLEQEFLENRGGIRFESSCNCMMLDIYVEDRVNPDETKLLFNVTLIGLGDFGNTLFSSKKNT